MTPMGTEHATKMKLQDAPTLEHAITIQLQPTLMVLAHILVSHTSIAMEIA
jgi:hypothetical protein